MTPWLTSAAGYIQWMIFLYFLAINSTYTLLILFALRDILKHAYLTSAPTARRMLTADAYFKPISVLVPAHNEASVISQSVMSLLNLHYPEFEIIVINDGSTDATLETLKRDFKLRPYTRPVRLQVPHAAIRDIYVSADYDNLIVVDKENGGKADAINAGINVSAYPLFCSIDADSMLEPDAVLKASKLFIEDDELIATGGIVRVLNGCTVKDGAVMEIGMPAGTIEAIQVLEYTRAFLSGRTGWNLLKSLLIISGAFGVFRKDMVVAVKGYRRTVGEDMDLVMRMHRHCIERRIPYKILFVPDPVCWTQVPFRLDMLRKQRNRWHRGLLDSLITNRSMILNPKYGKVSLLGVSYFTFVEVLGPVIELLGYISIPVLWFSGLLNTRFLVLLMVVAVLWGISINIGAIFLDTFNYRRYRKDSDILRLCLISVVEFLGYRQLTLYERVRACFQFRESSWGTQDRQSFHAAEAQKRPGLYDRLLASGVAEAASRFITKLPAFILAMMLLRGAELLGGAQPGTDFRQFAALAEAALAQDLATLARYLPPLFLASLPFLLLKDRRTGAWLLNSFWLLLLAAQAGLLQYFLTARVPLGSDLLAYSLSDIVTTAEGGWPPKFWAVAGTLAAAAGFWLALNVQRRRFPALVGRRTATALVALALLPLFLLPGRRPFAGTGSEDSYNLTLNKSAFFYDDCAAYFAAHFRPGGGAAALPGGAGAGFRYLDPKYPFLHEERTPDTLGPYFNVKKGAPPPDLVFIVLEGLGRAFTGPGAQLGSFTPKLDRTAETGLYWENFLANQGRTFGIFPSLFGSLPFGENGIAELGPRMPPHLTLLSFLKGQGYALRAYCGFDMQFDNDRDFYRRQGADALVDETNFGPGYAKSNVWGYADRELVTRVLAGEAAAPRGPSVVVFKTATSHTPYTFIGQEKYYARFEQRLRELGLSERDKASYRAYSEVYMTLLYLDDELDRFLAELRRRPGYANTIVVVTADHRLPEVPMGTRLDRYHVPLLILSPLLKKPASFKSVSSDFDVAPSLMAFFAHNYGMATPREVTWLGSGLDTETSFRNVHTIPIKQTKTNLVDFVSGTWFLNQDTLYAIGDGMSVEPADDAAALAQVRAQFDAFKAANDQFARTLALMPPSSAAKTGAYDAARTASPTAAPAGAAGLAVTEVRAPATAAPGGLAIEAVVANFGALRSEPFVPLAVLLAPNGRELTETYAPDLTLAPAESRPVRMNIKSAGLAPGRYYLAVFPSDPKTGKRTGAGRYRVPVTLK